MRAKDKKNELGASFLAPEAVPERVSSSFPDSLLV
jgi:hypothetical protein